MKVCSSPSCSPFRRGGVPARADLRADRARGGRARPGPCPRRSPSRGPRPTRPARGARVVKSQLNPQFYVNTTPGWSTGVPAFGRRRGAGGRRGPDPDDCSTIPIERGLRAPTRGRAWRLRSGARRRADRGGPRARGRLREARRGRGARRQRPPAAFRARSSCVRRERALAREGRRTELDVERAALEEARARQKLYAAESDRDLDRHELASLVGLPAGAPLAVVDEPERGRPGARDRRHGRRWPSLPRPPAARARRAGRRPRAVREADGAALQAVGDGRGAVRVRPERLRLRQVLPELPGERREHRRVGRASRPDGRPGLGAGRAVACAPGTGGSRASPARKRPGAAGRAGGGPVGSGRGFRSASPAAPWRWPRASLSEAQSIAREGRGEVDAVDQAQLSLSEAEEELAVARRDQVDARLQLLAIEGSSCGAAAPRLRRLRSPRRDSAALGENPPPRIAHNCKYCMECRSPLSYPAS